MTIRTTKSLLIGAIASLGLALGTADALAQTTDATGVFNTSESSSYVVPSSTSTAGGGVIRMRSKTGAITGKYGATATNRFPGTVIWMCTQTITPPAEGGTLFVTDMKTDGSGDKTFTGKYDVSGTYQPGDVATGKRVYTGTTFTFSGTSSGTSQIIPSENTNNGGGFDNVELSGSQAKTTGSCVAAGTAGLSINTLTQAGGAFTNQTNLALGANTHSVDNMVNASTDCGIELAKNGILNIKDLTNTTGKLKLNEQATVNLSGTFIRTAGEMDFACASTFNYTGTGAQTIVATDALATNGFASYGNLGISGGAKTAGGDFSVCGNFAGNANLDNDEHTMTMLNGNQNRISYGDPSTGIYEVTGKIKYENIDANKELTFNNKGTQIIFEAAPKTFTLDVRSATAPVKAGADNFKTDRDINRRINVAYTLNGTPGNLSNGKISSFKTLWTAADVTNIAGSVDYTKLKIAELYSTTKESKKLVRFGASTTVSASDRTITYAGGASGAEGIALVAATAPSDPVTVEENKMLFNGSDIVLSTKIQKITSIVHGRWSNPLTWDEGHEPYAYEDVDIKTSVWVGDDRALFGTESQYAYAVNERATGAPGVAPSAAANSITILDIQDAGLYISNQDGDMYKTNGSEVVFATVMQGNIKSGIFNKNARTTDSDINPMLNTARVNGIFISAVVGGDTPTYTPVLGASQFDNQGFMHNAGIIEVGTCQ